MTKIVKHSYPTKCSYKVIIQEDHVTNFQNYVIRPQYETIDRILQTLSRTPYLPGKFRSMSYIPQSNCFRLFGQVSKNLVSRISYPWT